VGLDLSWDALVLARTRQLRAIVQAPIERLPFQSESFDVVISCDVLNAVEDERGAVEELRRVCKPAGVVFLNLPAFNFLGGHHAHATGMIRRYTKRSLRQLLLDGGFAVERITYTNCLLFPLVFVIRLWSVWRPGRVQETGGFDFRRYPPAVNWALTVILACESWLVRWMDLPIGSSVTVRAVKPREGAHEPIACKT
jgi:SAM-dependent methyltransferase